MDTRIQLRRDKEQPQNLSYDNWLEKQITQAFDRMDSGEAVLTQHCAAQKHLSNFKTKIRSKS